MADVDLRYMAEGESVEGYVRYLIDELNYILQNLEDENMVDGLLKRNVSEVKNLPKKEEEKIFFEGTWLTSSTDKKNLTGWDDYTLFFVRVQPPADANIDILCYKRANTIRGNMFKPGSSSTQYNVQIDCTNEKQAEISYNYRHSDSTGNTDNTSILRIVGII